MISNASEQGLPPDELTVNELIREVPLTISVFNSFGIDTCCGGAVPVRQAARRDGADVDALLAALADAVRRTS
jgi:regulator of cell morphogenesis and NO signaling